MRGAQEVYVNIDEVNAIRPGFPRAVDVEECEDVKDSAKDSPSSVRRPFCY